MIISVHLKKSLFSKDYRIFLHLLRYTRREAGLTQRELGKRLGQTQSFVSKCERGERRLDVVELRAFCIALGLELQTFLARLELELAESSNVTPND